MSRAACLAGAPSLGLIVKRPILAFAPNDWDGQRMNRQHLLSGLARRGWQIVYTTGAPHFWARSSEEWRRLPLRGGVVERDGLLVDRPSRLLLRRDTPRAWGRLVVSAHLRRLLRAVAGSADSVICYVFHPSFWPYVEVLKPKRLVYHVYDAFHLVDDWDASLARSQNKLVGDADLLIATSLPMAESFPSDRLAEVKELPNAVDFDRFALGSQPECPPDLLGIPRPRILHPGSVNEKIDLDLVHRLASARPDWHWVLMGRLSGEARGAGELGRLWSQCLTLPNVHYLGVKTPDELPRYLHHGDVSAMCYRTAGRGWWQRLYPLRLHELLAVGRPIVASRLQALEPFSHVIALPVGLDDWSRALAQAIGRGGVGSVEARRAEASRNTWSHRTAQLDGWLAELSVPT
jgi:glycosyltransferase involved in cell wall biosynthesis